MKVLLHLSVLILTVSGLYADNNISSIKQEIITNSDQIIRIISDKETYNPDAKLDSFRKLVSITPGGTETHSFILKEVEYFFGDFLDSEKPWLGVDGRSGTLIGPVFNETGTSLSGKIVHQGIFTYNISNPAFPVETEYITDFDIE